MAASGKFFIAYDNKADSIAAVGGGNWNANLPVSNVLDYRVMKKARTSNAVATSSVIKLSLGNIYQIEAVAVLHTNLSPGAKVQVKLFANPDFTGLIYDGGLNDVYPAGCMPEAAIPFGAPNKGTARPSMEQLRQFQGNAFHKLTVPQQGRYIEISISDAANPDGFIEV